MSTAVSGLVPLFVPLSPLPPLPPPLPPCSSATTLSTFIDGCCTTAAPVPAAVRFLLLP